MSPRRPKASDEEVFAAAGRVMSRVGPAQLKLADIAAEAGVTAGALVQRFGSKRELLLALTARAARSTREFFAGLRATTESPLAALYAYADCFAAMGASPGALAHNLGYLQLDLTDPDFHRHTLAQARATSGALRRLLDDAVGIGELDPAVDTRMLARTVQVTLSGSLMTWAFYRAGPAARWVRDDLDAVLGPHRAVPSGATGSRRTGRRRAPRSRSSERGRF
jgi:AcrR family transcriptional regulator